MLQKIKNKDCKIMASENSNSLSKQEAIEQLRQTIRQLETITEQLEDTSVIDLPSSTSIQNLIATATELERIIAQKSALQDKQIEERSKNLESQLAVDNSIISPENTTSEIEDGVITPDKKVASEPKIRVFEPAPVNREVTKEKKLPESKTQPNPVVKNQRQVNKGKRTLIGIAAALLLIVVPLSWKLFLTNETPQLIARDIPKTIVQPATEPVVIPTPVREAEPTVNDEIPLENLTAIANERAENIIQPTIEPVVIPTPVREAEPSVNDEIPLENLNAIANKRAENIIQPTIEPVVIPTPVREAEPTVNDEIVQKDVLSPENIIEPKSNLTPLVPSESVAENTQKLAIETIDPDTKLTPEQDLIAALESKANNLASRYNDELVISIKPDFIDSIVVVTVANQWYEITAPRQDKIVSEMLKRSRSLEFEKLKITDSQNNLIARSPVIGEDMIVLRRTS